jgi:hypothetical protein
MDDRVIAAAVAKWGGLTKHKKLGFYTVFAFEFERIPFSEAELALAKQLTSKVVTLFHGGEAGLEIGSKLLPSSKTDISPSERTAKPFVLMTADPNDAAHYAARRSMNTGRATEVYMVLPEDNCTVSNNSLRLRNLAQADGEFTASEIMAFACHEYIASSATIIQPLELRPALMSALDHPG